MCAEAWQVLERAGLPLGGRAKGHPPAPEEIASAIAEVKTTAEGREREALCALIVAWSHGWPRSFAAAFGQTGEALVQWAVGQFDDANRYLKLRRIALANLAEVL